MSMGPSIGLIGDKETIRKLKRLASVDIRRALARGSRAGAKVLLPIARANAPILKHAKKGRVKGALRNAIKVRATKRSRRYVGAVVTVRGGGEQFKGDQFYAGFQEWGWLPGKRGGTAPRGKRVPPKLFLERAAKQSWQAAVARATALIRVHVEQAAAK